MSEGLSRRHFLRGLGTAVALPFLESLLPLGLGLGRKAWAAAGTPPVRMAFFYVPNGVNMAEWKPAVTGTGYTLPYTLQPLLNVKNELLVISNLSNDMAMPGPNDGAGDHARGATAFLTGVRPFKTEGSDLQTGVSLDQVAAAHSNVGAKTPFPSLELGVEGGSLSGSCDSGYACGYSRNISWRSSGVPATKEINPQALFDRLFGTGDIETAEQKARRRDYNLSILDFVREDTRRLQAKLGNRDKTKLDEYLSSVREVEKRVDQFDSAASACSKPERPAFEVANLQEHIDLHLELLAVAFACDLTRVASFMLGNEAGTLTYGVIGVPEAHHDLSHHGNDPTKLDKLRQINRFHIARMAKFLEKLKSIPEGDGTVLDNCMVMYGAGLTDGDAHNHIDMPVLVAGRGGGTIQTGRHLKVASGTQLANLHVALLNRAGVPTTSFGNSTGALSI